MPKEAQNALSAECSASSARCTRASANSAFTPTHSNT